MKHQGNVNWITKISPQTFPRFWWFFQVCLGDSGDSGARFVVISKSFNVFPLWIWVGVIHFVVFFFTQGKSNTSQTAAHWGGSLRLDSIRCWALLCFVFVCGNWTCTFFPVVFEHGVKYFYDSNFFVFQKMHWKKSLNLQLMVMTCDSDGMLQPLVSICSLAQPANVPVQSSEFRKHHAVHSTSEEGLRTLDSKCEESLETKGVLRLMFGQLSLW